MLLSFEVFFACEISAQLKYLLLKTNLLTLFTYLQYKAGGFKLQGTLKVHFSFFALFTLIDRGTLLFSFSNTIKEDWVLLRWHKNQVTQIVNTNQTAKEQLNTYNCINQIVISYLAILQANRTLQKFWRGIKIHFCKVLTAWRMAR